jgi:hypothetical protein
MGIPVDREGFFRAEIIDYGMCEASDAASQSVGVTIKCHLSEMYDFGQEAWVDWPYDQEATGVLWVICKNGSINDTACKSLVQSAGWDGDFESISDKRWEPTPCQVQVKHQEYKGKSEFRIAYVNPLDKIPGAMGNLNTDKVKLLKSQHGAALRALTSTLKTNAALVAKGKPAAPKAPPKAAAPASQPAGVAPLDNETPF